MSQYTAIDGYNAFSERGYASSRPALYDMRDLAEIIAHYDAARYADHTNLEEYQRMLTVSEFQVDDDAAAAIESIEWALDYEGLEWGDPDI